MPDFELVYEIRVPVERESYTEARVLAHERLVALREDIETGDPDGPFVSLKGVNERWCIPACTCISPRDRFGQYHTLDCAISKQAQDRIHGKML